MACKNCAKIRSAILHGKMAEAAGLTVTALREKLGLSESQPTSGYVAGVSGIENDVPEQIMPLPPGGKIVVKAPAPAAKGK